MSGRTGALLGSLAFFCLAPGMVAGVIPWALTGWRAQPALLGAPALPWIGYLLVVAGASVVGESFVRFAVKGLGTPAPVAPTRFLIVSGLYRHVRNPMYVGVLSVIVGQALVLGSTRLLEYAALVWLCFFVFVVLYEEPSLQRRFGASYEVFRRAVPRWWPRITPWQGPAGGEEGARVTVLDSIGRTSLIPLRHIVAAGSARILLKMECENPTGSMKDRMALAMVEAAEADGRLRPGGSVVEYTGGSTGVSLAFVCAAKHLPLQIVTSEASSKEKRDHMTAFGARLTLVASPTGGTTKALTLEMIETARRLASAPGSYWTDQLNNTDQLASYERMGEEIWEQASGQVSAFVHSVGTGGSLRGISTCLRGHNAAVQIVAVEPEESAVLSGRPSGCHKIEGTGAGFVVPLWKEALANEIQTVSTDEAMAAARRLARLEGIFAGTSTGGNVAVALRVAKRLGPAHTVVTVAVDSGMKYLSTGLYGQA